MGLKKFLLNSSLISERAYKEIELWEEYLIFAQLLGIAKEVNRQFSTLYPDLSIISESVNILNKEFPNVFFNVFMIFYFDRTIKSVEQVEQKIKLPILGSVQEFNSKRGRK